MIKLLRNGLLFLVIAVVPYFLIQYWFIRSYDIYYLKVSGGRSDSIITGLSRAGTGISPEVIKNQLNLTHEPKNLAFSNTISPYGKCYFHFLKEKILDQPGSANVHIVCVSPAAIMDYHHDHPTKRESTQTIYNIRFLNQKPNLEYFLYQPPLGSVKRLFSLFQEGDEKDIRWVTHKNGWIETITDEGYKKRQLKNPNNYRQSDDREHYFRETIDMLCSSGTVFLVRLPVADETRRVEEQIHPGFDAMIQSIAEEKSIHYLNYSVGSHFYEYYDEPGSHLTGESAKEFTIRLTKDIKQLYPGRWQ